MVNKMSSSVTLREIRFNSTTNAIPIGENESICSRPESHSVLSLHERSSSRRYESSHIRCVPRRKNNSDGEVELEKGDSADGRCLRREPAEEQARK